MNKTHLIIGAGEIGQAIFNVLSPYYKVLIRDENPFYSNEEINIIHICFPYNKEFKSEVKKYQKKYKPDFTIIHSTVPVGTSKNLKAIHSPVVGLHPHLEESLKTFTKFLGGEKATEVADVFRKAGMKVYLFEKSETTELLKILDTTYYGVCVEYTKDVKRQCDKHNIPFEAWTIYNENYNEGYKKLGYGEYVRPNLVPIMKKLGGHCVLPNTELLETPFTRFIQELNG